RGGAGGEGGRRSGGGMMLVVEAGGRCVRASFSNSTVPVRASMRMADFARTTGGCPSGTGSGVSGTSPSSSGSFWAREEDEVRRQSATGKTGRRWTSALVRLGIPDLAFCRLRVAVVAKLGV